MAEFDYKNFNPEVFEAYSKKVPNLTRNELLKAGVFKDRSDLKARMKDQAGGNYFVEPMQARIGGSVINYDGNTNISATGRTTYSQGKVILGRANAWAEKDFSYDITGGVDFLAQATEIEEYFDNIDQIDLLAILEGIFSMTGTENEVFVNNHTLDISAEQTPADTLVSATTLNTLLQKACGDNMDAFSVVIMHSAIATNLGNLNLLNYLKYTDANGVQRDLKLGTWSGKTVLIDDGMPYANSKYTTYALGKGAFDFLDAGAKVPFEMDRDPFTDGGTTAIIARKRKMFAPLGISYAPVSIPTSPTATQLKVGASWTLARNATDATDVFPHKAIPIARIISLG
jgi:hypothetical protein